jgi:hypothetical protein
MVAIANNPDVLAEVVARVFSTDTTEFEMEYEGGEEQVATFCEAAGVEVAAFRSDSDDAQDLRRHR